MNNTCGSFHGLDKNLVLWMMNNHFCSEAIIGLKQSNKAFYDIATKCLSEYNKSYSEIVHCDNHKMYGAPGIKGDVQQPSGTDNFSRIDEIYLDFNPPKMSHFIPPKFDMSARSEIGLHQYTFSFFVQSGDECFSCIRDKKKRESSIVIK